MERLLLLNTFGEVCAAGIWEMGTGLICTRVADSPNSHASLLATYTQECLETTGMRADDLAAVVCMKGPGSYTGLRIGLSFAKGLCLGSDLPLLALNSLEAMACDLWLSNAKTDGVYWPLIDARRMEVYGASYRPEWSELCAPGAFVLDETSFTGADIPVALPWFTGGDGAEKSLAFMPPGVGMVQLGDCLTAMGMLAEQRYAQGKFDDLAYTEAEYLKPFYSPASLKRGN